MILEPHHILNHFNHLIRSSKVIHRVFNYAQGFIKPIHEMHVILRKLKIEYVKILSQSFRVGGFCGTFTQGSPAREAGQPWAE